MNELHKATSPYLLQHSSNPIFWKIWNENSLALAQNSNKLMIISIGYSACHWCHVMEKESFENHEVALIMNSHFVSIKVDREERPDVDAVYMKSLQLMNQQGGWPLNMICLPDGRPVFGGTYFKKDVWISRLQKLQHLFETEPTTLENYAQELQKGLHLTQLPDFKDFDSNELNTEIQLKEWIKEWQKMFDTTHGGYLNAPKFMLPNHWSFLMNYGHCTQNKSILQQVELTLDKMAMGGIFDVVGGGFSRYSVDERWHIPHFEKMLYDNAQLVSLYADAYKLFKKPLYKTIVEKTLTFVETELLSSWGGFYSALDADSVNLMGEHEEGAFYTWSLDDLKQIISSDFGLFEQVFNINSTGYWENGHYVLIQTQTLEHIAQKNFISVKDLEAKKCAWEKILIQHRTTRIQPRLDHKCLTSWNALMIKGFVDAYKAFQNPKYLNIALKNAQFILHKMKKEDGTLFRNFTNNEAQINAYLEDYATVIQSFISLYEVSFDDKWLYEAKNLCNICLDDFFDEEHVFFRFSSRKDASLIAPHFDIEDQVTPSSNSLMGYNLYQLGIYFEHHFYTSTAEKMTKKIISNIQHIASSSQWFSNWYKFENQSIELSIIGEQSFEKAQQINAMYLPNVSLAVSKKSSSLSLLKNRFQEHKTLFYVCKNKSCSNAVEDINSLNLA